MRDIRVIAGVLDDAGAREILSPILERKRESRPPAARQRDRHGIGEGTGEQRLVSGARRGRRASPVVSSAKRASARLC